MKVPLESLEQVLEIAKWHEDRGPRGEGWQSDELVHAWMEVEGWLDAIRLISENDEDLTD